jgi:hypothetical protein
MWICVVAPLGVIDLHPSQHLETSIPALIRIHLRVEQQTFLHLGSDTMCRIKRHHRLLKYHAHGGAAQTTPSPFSPGAQVFSVEQYSPLIPANSTWKQIENRSRSQGLPATRFPDNCYNFASRDIE